MLDDVVHGTCGYDAGCGCATCRAANATRAAESTKRRYLGIRGPNDLVDISRAQEWVQYLRSRGMTLDQIADQAGIGYSAADRVSTGRSQGARMGGREKLARIRLVTEAKILAVKPPDAPLSGGSKIDARLTRRRLRGLMALGYTQAWVAAQIGRKTNSKGTLSLGKLYVTVETARLIADLCERVGETPGPSNYTRSWAANRGYLPPQYYDDDFRILSL